MGKGISVGTEIQKELSGAGIFKERAGGQDSHAKQSGRWLHKPSKRLVLGLEYENAERYCLDGHATYPLQGNIRDLRFT